MTTEELVAQLDELNDKYGDVLDDECDQRQYWFELWQERLRSGKDGFVLWRFDTYGGRKFYGGFQPGKEQDAVDALRYMNNLVKLYKISGERWGE